jgi:putative protease
MQGFLVNDVQGRTVTPNRMPDIKVGATIWRNNDQRFEKQLQGRTAERKIGVEMLFCLSRRGFSLDLKDEDGVSVVQHMAAEHIESDKPLRTSNTIVKQLSKLGNTPFVATMVTDVTEGRYFIPASTLNELRRRAVELLKEYRLKHFRPEDRPRHDQHQPCPATELDYRANIVNDKAEAFYRRHGASVMERGVEQTADFAGKALMTTKYCLRYELGCCLQGKSEGTPQVALSPSDTLWLRNNDRRFRLDFDCRQCQMHIIAAE